MSSIHSLNNKVWGVPLQTYTYWVKTVLFNTLFKGLSNFSSVQYGKKIKYFKFIYKGQKNPSFFLYFDYYFIFGDVTL